MTCLWIGSFAALTCETKSLMPPSYLNSTRSPPARSSVRTMCMPLVRNAVSRRRWVRISASHSIPSVKISASGRKLMTVPVP